MRTVRIASVKVLLPLILAVLVGCAGIEVKDFPLTDGELEVLTTPDGVEFVRTPDSLFEDLPDWPYDAKYVEIDGLRQAYAETGPVDGEVVLLLHGQPSWSYLYRKMMPVLAEAGYRAIAMDHIGMGRSDKPIDLDYYSYDNHVYRLEQFIQKLGLENITTFVQDWGSLIGLNVVGIHPDWFARVVLGDGALPVVPEGTEMFPLPADPEKAIKEFESGILRIPPQQPEFYTADGELKPIMARQGGGSGYFGNWIFYSRNSEDFRASTIVEALTYFPLSEEVRAAYDAPFPARIAMAGPRTFPGLANTLAGKTQRGIQGLMAFDKPFLTIWASNDPGNLGRKEVQEQMIDLVPGSAGQPHTRLPKASHFLQDDQGAEIARLMVEFMQANPIE